LIRDGKKFVVLKNLGSFKDKDSKDDTDFDKVQAFFEALGVEYRGEWTDNPLVVQLLEKDSRMVEFERDLTDEIEGYENIKVIDPQGKVYLKLGRSDILDSAAAAVLTTSRGGLAMADYGMFINYRNDARRWRLDPFRFFNEAFGLQDQPRVDTTTLFGRRIFYSHIDGDGFRNATENDPRKYSSEVMYDEILTKYDLPVSVSFITAEIDPRYFGSARNIAVARRILSLPNVEAGAHGFAHPLDWKKQLVSFPIPGYSRKMENLDDDIYLRDNAYPNAARVTVAKDEYLRREILGSVEYINANLAPPGKRVVNFHWTGDCQPPAEAILLTQKIGLHNLNGGDSRFDRKYPTYTRVAPLTRQDKGVVQPYSSAANENIYTEGWRRDFHAFQYVIETFEQTENPALLGAPARRVAPINVYYHFYSAEKPAALQSLKMVYDYVQNQPVIPIFMSEYLEAVEGFHSARIEPLAERGWRIKDYGGARTIRFDDTKLSPDLEHSTNVMGFSRNNDSLYVFLAEAPEAEIYFTGQPAGKAYLKESANMIKGWMPTDKGFEFRGRGFKEVLFVFANITPGAVYSWQAVAADDPRRVKSGEASAGPNGEMTVTFPFQGWFDFKLEKTR